MTGFSNRLGTEVVVAGASVRGASTGLPNSEGVGLLVTSLDAPSGGGFPNSGATLLGLVAAVVVVVLSPWIFPNSVEEG